MWKQLLAAISRQNVAEVKRLIELMNIDDFNKDYSKLNQYEIPLHLAAIAGQNLIFNEIIAKFPKTIDIISSNKYTVLDLAARNNHPEIVEKILLLRPSLVDTKDDEYGYTALHWAADYGHLAVVVKILNLCPNSINNLDNQGRTPLHWAVQFGHNRVIEILLSKEPQLATIQDKNGISPIHLAAKSESGILDDLTLDQLLLDRYKLQDNQGKTPLHWAVEFDNDQIAKLLLSKEPELITIQDNDGNTPIHLAKCSSKTLELLLSAHQLINNKDITILHIAAKYGYSSIVDQILKSQPKLAEFRDNNGNTVLHLAAQGGFNLTVDCILKLNPGIVNIKNNEGKTPLHCVAEQKKLANIPCDNIEKPYNNIEVPYNKYCSYCSQIVRPNVLALTNPNPEARNSSYKHEQVALIILRLSPESAILQDNLGNTALHLAANNNEYWIAGVFSPKMLISILGLKSQNTDDLKILSYLDKSAKYFINLNNYYKLNSNSCYSNYINFKQDYCKLGNILFSLGKKEEAHKAYEEATKFNYHKLQNLEIHVEPTPTSEIESIRAMQQINKYITSRHQSEEKKLYEEAIDIYKTIIEQNNDSNIAKIYKVKIASCYNNIDKPKMALDIVNKILEQDGNDESANEVKATALIQLGDQNRDSIAYDEAVKLYKEALKINSGSKIIKQRIGNILFNQKNYSEAKKYFEIGTSEYVNFQLKLAEKMAKKGNHQEALKYYKKSINFFDKNSREYNDTLEKIVKQYTYISKEFYQKKSYVKALKYCDEALSIKPTALKSLIIKAQILNAMGEEDLLKHKPFLALTKYEQVVELFNDDNSSHNDKVKDLIYTALRYKAEISYTYAQDKKANTKVAKDLKEVLKYNQHDQPSLLMLAKISKDQKDYLEALKYLNFLPKSHSEGNSLKIWLYNAQGDKYYSEKLYNKALECFYEVEIIEPHSHITRNNIAWTLMAKAVSEQEYDEVIKIFKSVKEYNPDYEEAKIGLSIAHNRLGEFYRDSCDKNDQIKAQKEFKKALEVMSSNLYINNLGEIYLEQGKYAEAIKCFSEVKKGEGIESNRALVGKEISLNREIKEFENIDSRIDEIKDWYDDLIVLSDKNHSKQAQYLCAKAKFILEKTADNEASAVLAREAQAIDKNCIEAEFILVRCQTLIGNLSDPSFDI